jgi:hypothetical protein
VIAEDAETSAVAKDWLLEHCSPLAGYDYEWAVVARVDGVVKAWLHAKWHPPRAKSPIENIATLYVQLSWRGREFWRTQAGAWFAELDRRVDAYRVAHWLPDDGFNDFADARGAP